MPALFIHIYIPDHSLEDQDHSPDSPEDPDHSPDHSEDPDHSPEDPDHSPENPEHSPEDPDHSPEDPDHSPEDPVSVFFADFGEFIYNYVYVWLMCTMDTCLHVYTHTDILSGMKRRAPDSAGLLECPEGRASPLSSEESLASG